MSKHFQPKISKEEYATDVNEIVEAWGGTPLNVPMRMSAADLATLYHCLKSMEFAIDSA